MKFHAFNISFYSGVWGGNLEHMPPNVGLWTQAGLLLAVAIVFLGLRRQRSNLQLPPGPRALPVIGNLHQLSVDIHRDFENLGKKYGPLMYLRMGAVPVVVVQNAAMAAEVLKTHDEVFANRPQDLTVVRKLVSGDDLGFAPVGPQWRYLKKVLVSELVSPKRLATFKEQRMEEAMETMTAMMEGSKQGDAVDVRGQMSALMYNVVARMVVGKKFDGSASGAKGKQAFRNLMVDYFTLFNGFYIPDWFPYTRVLGDFQGTENRMDKIATRINTFFQDCINEHREARICSTADQTEGQQVKDFIDLLLDVPNIEGENEFGDDNIKNLLKASFIAGTEASASFLTWVLAELVHKPEMLKRVQDEVDSVVGRERLVREEDIPQLKLLGAIVKETLRLHPSPFLIPRQPSENTKVGGYDIPSTARVFVSVWAIQRDPAVWERPLEFLPDRFLGRTRDFAGSMYDYMPFGSGRRMCPGMNSSLLMVQFQLAHLVHLCNYTLPGGVEPEDMDMREANGFNGQKKVPFQVIATPRLAPNFYAKNLGYKC